MECFSRYSLKTAQILTLLIPVLVFAGKAPVDIACSLVGALFLAGHLARRDLAWAKPLWVRAALGLWAYLLLRSLFAEDVLLALDRAAPWIRYPVFSVALGYWVITNKRFSRHLLISIMLGCAMLAADALLQYLTGFDILGKPKAAESRLTGPFNNARVGYTLTWMVFPVLIYCMQYKPQKPWKSCAKMLLLCLLCLGPIISGERTPTLLLGLGLALAGFLLPAIRCRLHWLVPMGAIAIVTLLYFNPVLYKRQVLSTGNVISNYWNSPYGQITQDSLDLLRDEPVFGIGIQHYRVETAIGSDARQRGHSHPHNFYLELLVEGGIVGLALLVLLFGAIIRRIMGDYALWQGDFLLTGLVVGILIRLWPIISNPSFYASWNVIPFWLILGWYMALIRIRNEERKPDGTPAW